MIEKERERRLKKKLGATNGTKSMLGLAGPSSPHQRPPPKKQKKSFTGVNDDNQIEQFFDDFEDLDQEKILDFLKTAKVIKIADKHWYKKPLPEPIRCNKSLYLVQRDTMFRRICYNLQLHKYFDRFIMLLIFLSSLKLATDTYMTDLEADSPIM